MLYHFSVVTFLNFLFVFKQFYCDIFGCGFLYIHLVGLYIFWMYRLMFFIRFGKFSVHSLNIFSALSTPSTSPPSAPALFHVLTLHMYWCIFWYPTFLWTSSFSFFSLCSSCNIISFDLSSSLVFPHYASSDLLFSPSNEFFILVIVLFNLNFHLILFK